MNGATSTPWAAPDADGRPWLFLSLLALGGVATVGLAVVTNGSVIATVAPVLAVGMLVAIWLAPIRITLLALIFLALAFDSTDDGPWNSPFAPLGRLLTHNLNKSIPVEALALPVMGMLLVYLLVIHIHRRLSGSRIDAAGRVEAASPMFWTLGLSLATVVLVIAMGARRGANIQMAKIQVQMFLMLLLTAYLLAMSLRGMRDYRLLAALIVAAACSKALMAAIAYNVITPPPEVATIHGDSMLFTGAAIFLITRFAERPVRRSLLVCSTLLPLLFAGMLANSRRLAWVELAVTLLVLFIVSRWSPFKRALTRAVLLAVPLIVIYVAVGWNSKAAFFAPVQTFRSVQDAEVDASTLFRDLENYNLLQTMRVNPIMGRGFGLPFDLPVVTPDLSFFEEYHYLPHNSVLGLLAFAGLIGFTGLFLSIVVAVYFAARSYHFARLPGERIAAFTALSVIVIYLIQCWGDIGFSEKQSVFLVGPALAVIAQLAHSTGAWTPRPPAEASARRA